jgi:hypothetical protein
MTITFEHDNDNIFCGLQIVISYARKHKYIFVVQTVLWMCLIIGLQQGLVIHIDNLRRQAESTNNNEQELSSSQRDVQDESRDFIGSNFVHPDIVTQLQNIS